MLRWTRKLRNEMSQTKRKTLKSLLTSITACLVATFAATAGTIGEAPIIKHDGLSMLGGILVVRLQSGANIHDPQSSLPDGYTIVERFLAPFQTVLYGGNMRAKSTSTVSDLMSAEERLVRTVVVQYGGPIHPYQAVAALLKDPRVEFAEPYYVGEQHALPNDPLVSQQGALNVMQMSQAWDIERGSGEIVIGISDNGVDQLHEDIRNSLAVNPLEVPNNGVDDDGNGYIDDYNGYNFAAASDGTLPGNTYNEGGDGHGTKVAGIACASTNNGMGIAGIGYNCRMFPMKTALANVGGIIYGYQSLIYAGLRGFDVVNCSWGLAKPWSPVDQSVIDYCLANDVVIVASAGNHGDAGSDEAWTLLNFPASYDGVMGVGETTTNDDVTTASGLGRNAMVMAPGNRALTTAVGGGYTSSGVTGTSFAAPMGAGLAGLVRSKFPQLTARQVITHIRLATDDIDGKNPAEANVLPGRLNGLKALSTSPLSRAGFRIAEIVRRSPNGEIVERFGAGDTLDITYTLINDLGPSGDVTFSLDVAMSNGWNVITPTTNITHGVVPTGTKITVGPFRVRLLSVNQKPIQLRVNIFEGSNEDALLDHMLAPSLMSTMQNERLAYSIGDDGTFGFSNSTAYRQGIGFTWTNKEWLLSPSGLIFSEGNSRALHAFDNNLNTSDFKVDKSFTEPQREKGILTDQGIGSREIGVRVGLRCTFPAPDAQATVIEVDIENRSSVNLSDVAAGLFLDWDIGYAGQNNRTRLAPEALPVSFRETGEAQLFERDGIDATVICAALTSEIEFQAQSAGMLLWQIVDDSDGLTDADIVTLLSSGASIQTTETGDVCGVIGMKFPGSLAPGGRRKFMIVITVGATSEEAAALMQQTILEPNSVNEGGPSRLFVSPNPVNDVVVISTPAGAERVRIIDIAGRISMDESLTEGSSTISLPTTHLPAGSYMVVVNGNGINSTSLIQVIH